MYNKDKIIAIIPARGGSKGLVGKNIVNFDGKPLIYWTIDAVRGVLDDENICVSSDDEKIIRKVENYNLVVPFKRPDHLGKDNSSTDDVIHHALDFYRKKGREFEWILLLQPTSPLRDKKHVLDVLEMCDEECEMIVSVKESHAAVVLCEETQNGFMKFTINKKGDQRQKLKTYYEYNGAIYFIRVNALMDKSIHQLTYIKKYVMDTIDSVDIDNICDLKLAEFYKNEYKK